MDLNHILAVSALVAITVAFVAGLLITALTGAARPVKILLAILTAIVIVAVIGGIIFSRGLLIYLLFQLIALVLILYFVVVFGAVCGGGIYLLLHKKTRGKRLSQPELADYLPAAEFSALEGITEERALSGFYQGGRHQGRWYIHKSELSQKTIHQEAV
jgi:hypothetical protein